MTTSSSNISPFEIAERAVEARLGHGRLEVANVCGQSAATVVESRSPLKILVPRPRGESVWSYLGSFGGGLLPGDEIDVRVSVGENARCFLGTQSSTKIFRGGARGAVKNRLNADVGSNALFVYAPDVAQGFADSRFQQRQNFELKDESANLVFLDWYSSGRQARDERWAFSEYSSRTEIRVAGRIILLDSVRLNADDDLLSLPDRMGRANCVATVVLVGAELKTRATELIRKVAESEVSKRMEVVIVASAIEGGAVVRFAGISVEKVAREIFSRLNFFSELLGDNPFERKW